MRESPPHISAGSYCADQGPDSRMDGRCVHFLMATKELRTMHMVRLVYVSRMTEECDTGSAQKVLKISAATTRLGDYRHSLLRPGVFHAVPGSDRGGRQPALFRDSVNPRHKGRRSSGVPRGCGPEVRGLEYGVCRGGRHPSADVRDIRRQGQIRPVYAFRGGRVPVSRAACGEGKDPAGRTIVARRTGGSATGSGCGAVSRWLSGRFIRQR